MTACKSYQPNLQLQDMNFIFNVLKRVPSRGGAEKISPARCGRAGECAKANGSGCHRNWDLRRLFPTQYEFSSHPPCQRKNPFLPVTGKNGIYFVEHLPASFQIRLAPNDSFFSKPMHGQLHQSEGKGALRRGLQAINHRLTAIPPGTVRTLPSPRAAVMPDVCGVWRT
jgi:hypothetical protein